MTDRHLSCGPIGVGVSRRSLAKGAAALVGAGHSFRSRAAEPRRIRGIALDAFTVFDPRHISEVAERHFPQKGRQFASSWASKLFDLTWLATAADHYREFRTISDAAQKSDAEEMNLNMTSAAREDLLGAYSQLTIWPDVPLALDRLRAAGIRLRFLSNLGEATLISNMRNTGIAHYFDAPLSTNLVRQFKPSPKAYAMAKDAFGLERDEIGFAAFARWDALGASWFGYRTAWKNRAGALAEMLEPAPAVTSRGFEGVLKLSGL
jgi:2-haloacid dehalogenase